MKEYFNENERKNHLIITCCQTAIDDMLKTNAPTDEKCNGEKCTALKLYERELRSEKKCQKNLRSKI